MKSQPQKSIAEALKLLTERDEKDALIDKKNRNDLIKNGFSFTPPAKTIKIDTGEVVGAENVVDIIIKNLESGDKIIAIEGLSGVGKSETTRFLKARLGASVLSLSDVFRLLTWKYCVKKQKNHEANIQTLDFCIENDELCLKCEGGDVENLRKHLHDQEFSSLVPDVAKDTQEIVIKFVASAIKSLKKQYDGRILLEGRAFSLDFIPCDLRVYLKAPPMVRAERRMKQYN